MFLLLNQPTTVIVPRIALTFLSQNQRLNLMQPNAMAICSTMMIMMITIMNENENYNNDSDDNIGNDDNE